VPSPSGNFKVQFYWDTYFTNLGLLRSGRLDLAKSNCDSLLWWIDRLGYVPNSAFVGDDNRSQPPLLCAMVRDVFEKSHDIEWLRGAVPRLEREYTFWIQNRSLAGGLCHFGNQATDEYLIKFYDDTLVSRLGLSPSIPHADKLKVASNFLSEAESGTDFTPVYSGSALDFADVKLNSILYVSETNLAYFHRLLDPTEGISGIWRERASRRAQNIQDNLWDASTGLYRSRNMATKRLASIACADTFFPLWAGIASQAQAKLVCSNLHLFEREFGLAQTEPFSTGSFQWAFPIGWPPSQWIAASGLKRYGFSTEARRIADEYCAAQIAMYGASGHLWEKIDVNTGKPARSEYAADPMLGWTAGVFLAMKGLLDEHSDDHGGS
jgi:alpha,alpha-trehalase